MRIQDKTKMFIICWVTKRQKLGNAAINEKRKHMYLHVQNRLNMKNKDVVDSKAISEARE